MCGAQLGRVMRARLDCAPAWHRLSVCLSTVNVLPSPPPPTPLAEVDARVDALVQKKDEWVKVSATERIALLRRCMSALSAVAEGWVMDGSRAKGIAEGSPLEGEEWLAGPWPTMRLLRLFVQALEAGAQPRLPAVTARPDGQLVARVFPATWHDRVLFAGCSADVWIVPGKPATQGATYREGAAAQGKVALVLGAGNVSSIAPMDALYKLIVDNAAVVLKVHPVNAWLGPHLEKALDPLIAGGYLAVVHGGADVGAYLASHAKVDTLHITGTDKTYDAIVWGSDPSVREKRRAEDDPNQPPPLHCRARLRDARARRARSMVGGGHETPGATGRRHGGAQRQLQR